MRILNCLIMSCLFSSVAHAENVSVVLKLKFKSGSVSVQQSEQYVVDNLYSVVEAFPESRIYILGHTDSSGAESVNQELSEARAKTVHNKLLAKGAVKDKTSVKGMGESAPIADNKTSQGRATNRRVVVTFANLNEQKVAELKNTLANTKGMTVLKKESELVDSFIGEKEAVFTKAKQDKLNAEKLAALAAVPVVAKTKKNSPQESFRYSVATGVYYNVLDATDRDSSNAEAEWVSDLNIPVGGAAQFRVAQFWLGLKLFAHIQDYKIERSPNYVWDEDTPLLVRGSLISDYETSRFGLGFDIDFNQESFIYETNGNVRLEDELFIGATLRAKYKWLEGPWSSRLGLDLSYPATTSSDIDSKGELGYIVSLDFRRAEVIGSHSLTAKLYYGLRNFNNDQNDQVEEVLGLMLSLDSRAWL